MIPFHFRAGTDLASWIVYVVMGLAIVYVMTRSAIAAPLRRVLVPPGTATGDRPVYLFATTLIYCPSCFGFWTGVALGHLFPITSGITALDIFVSGCFTMVVAGAWMHFIDPGAGEAIIQAEHPELFQEPDVETTKSEEGGTGE